MSPPPTSRIYYPFTPSAIVDAATILPEVLEYISNSNTSLAFLRFVRVLRILRILRAFRKVGSAMSGTVAGRPSPVAGTAPVSAPLPPHASAAHPAPLLSH